MDMFSYTSNILLVLKRILLDVIINAADGFLSKHASFEILSFSSHLEGIKQFTIVFSERKAIGDRERTVIFTLTFTNL